MNPFFLQIVNLLVRAAVLWIAAKFGAELSDDQTMKIVAQVVPVVLVLAASIYGKYRSQQKLVTAQTMGKDVTQEEVKDKIAAGLAPSVLTPVNEVPR